MQRMLLGKAKEQSVYLERVLFEKLAARRPFPSSLTVKQVNTQPDEVDRP